jgi:hypothetical protein
MQKLKLASKFLTRSQALKQASKQRQLLKVQGKNKTHKVEVLFAYNFWRTNKWFNQKKLGLPNPTDQDYIVIVTEISKPNTINMPIQKKQTKQDPSLNISEFKQKGNSRANVLPLKPRINQQQTEVTLPLSMHSITAKSYSILVIPVPFYYRSVA